MSNTCWVPNDGDTRGILVGLGFKSHNGYREGTWAELNIPEGWSWQGGRETAGAILDKKRRIRFRVELDHQSQPYLITLKRFWFRVSGLPDGRFLAEAFVDGEICIFTQKFDAASGSDRAIIAKNAAMKALSERELSWDLLADQWD